MKKPWYIAVVAALAALGSLAFLQGQTADGDVNTSDTAQIEVGPEGQPIAFPHNRHAGDLQLDCQFCHFSAERSSSAGIPPVSTCMGCHTFVAGTERPEEIAKLRGFWERGEAIPWHRIYKVSDHVAFPHMRHVSAGLECQECHGPVEEIDVIQAVQQPLTMGWCLNCHIEQGATRDCMACHY